MLKDIALIISLSVNLLTLIKFINDKKKANKSTHSDKPFSQETRKILDEIIKEFNLLLLTIEYNGEKIQIGFKFIGTESDVLLKSPLRELPVAIDILSFKQRLTGLAFQPYFPKEIDRQKHNFFFNRENINDKRLKFVNEDLVHLKLGIGQNEYYEVYDSFNTLNDFLIYLIEFKQDLNKIDGVTI